jgi:metalloendopeptidase OMA1, mitochondrial
MLGGSREIDYDDTSAPRRRFKVLPLIIFAIFAVFYYFSNQNTVPITGRSQLVDMSLQDEAALGYQAYAEIMSQSDVVPSGPEVERIRSIGERLKAVIDDPGFEWEFNLVNSEQANAFCLPGGKVAVYTGILPIAQNDDGLAIVMAHEISHAIARHGAERMAQERLAQFGQLAVGMSVSDMDEGSRRAVLGAFGLGTQFGILLPFSRTHEEEADYMGLIYAARACFNPEEAPKVWERMTSSRQGGTPPAFLSTHPSDEKRIENFGKWMPQALEERAKFCR